MPDDRTNQVIAWLRTLPFFQDMPQEYLVALLPRLRRRRLQDREVLCRTGDPPGCSWLVVRGSLEVRSPKGRVVTRVETGGAFGIGTLLGHRRRILWAVAVGETWVLELDRASWEDLIARRDGLSLFLAQTLAGLLASQMRHADEILRALVLSSSKGAAAAPSKTATPPGPPRAPEASPPVTSSAEGLGRMFEPPVPASAARRAVTRISEQDLETFLAEMESKVGLADQSNIRVVHSAEKPVRPKNPGL
ncbi:MAG TPA: Crp/Fnr family transcriptional regulator [Myxococcota bacterium]|nr:Crp/Fnr family transcriptional regulator [Myxococcota bacterium]HQK52347.1 Crp/Fnr family transcriptional regulator [Myxococcota bacterium]